MDLKKKDVMTFYHPPGTHDDQLWALALAVYAAKQKEPEPHLYVIKTRRTTLRAV